MTSLEMKVSVVISRLRSWWWKSTEHPVVAIFILGGSALVIALIIVIVLGYWLNWHWTGLVPETSEPKQHMKTLWDWLQLLIIPFVLAVGGYIINTTISRTEQKNTQDNQQEAALQSYLDRMSELLLEKELRKSQPDDEVRNVARARTLTVLTKLNAHRKRSIIQFLSEAHLISIIDLSEAELDGTQLYRIDLSDALLYHTHLEGTNLGASNLNHANLKDAQLRKANLYGADLRYANLNEAFLSEARLSNANLSNADLSDAVLCGADLRNSKLSNTNLKDAHLCSAQLTFADRRTIDIDGPNLTEVDLSTANLEGVDFEKANLRGAIITDEQLKTVKSLKGTIMPDGSKHP